MTQAGLEPVTVHVGDSFLTRSASEREREFGGREMGVGWSLPTNVTDTSR